MRCPFGNKANTAVIYNTGLKNTFRNVLFFKVYHDIGREVTIYGSSRYIGKPNNAEIS